MSSKKYRTNADTLDHIVAGARQVRASRGNIYRERALKILPWICAWCGREFVSKKLHELTVHHKDHNHNNNPPDGSNWELLCLYCHDSEHSRSLDQDIYGKVKPGEDEEPSATYKAFSGLKSLLKDQK
ncbi:MAG: YajD family HNH nuclease [Deltaproteobacteria bacterium]|nr:YajD family HNH nuclease [Deltaproteobacteria bacterium]